MSKIQADILTISIVTPSFNQGRYIEDTILSVLSQGYPKLEYIIIDGGSSDNTVDVIKKYEKYISYWISEPDNGQSHAINKGLRMATGEIIAWINSDDIYFDGAFKKVNQVFTQNLDIDVLYSNGVWIDENSKIIRKRKNTHFHYNTWLYGMADPFQPEVFYRKSVLKKAGYVDESFQMMMDREWWIRMANSRCKFKYINGDFAAIRKYSDTKTVKLMNVNIEERWKLHDIYWTGFRFQGKKLQYIHWRAFNIFFLIRRKILITWRFIMGEGAQ